MRHHQPRNYDRRKYNLINAQKYFGPKHPEHKSAFELRMMEWCDKNANVVRWAYEPYCIQYVNKMVPGLPDWTCELVDNKQHKYYIDFHVELIDEQGKTKTYIIEIKPNRMTIQPKEPKKKSRPAVIRYVNEMKEFIKNQNKWAVANEFCKQKGYEFKILTEKNLFY